MTNANIVTAVRLNMDEIADNDATWTSDQDSSELDNIIKSKIGEAVQFVLENAREDLLDNSLIKAEEKTNLAVGNMSGNSADYVDISAPTSYTRMISIRLNEWRRAIKVADFIEEGDDDELRVSDPVSGATIGRPAVVRMIGVGTSASAEKFRAYGCKGTTTKAVITYVGTISASATDINVGSKLSSALINYITGLVWTTYNEKDRAQECFELAMVEMGNMPKNNN